MKRKLLTYEQFIKNTLPSEEVKGTSEIVKDHYSAEKDAKLDDPKNKEVKGNGEAEHTEEVKADDLGDPKNAKVNESAETDMIKQLNVDMDIKEIQDFVKKNPKVKDTPEWVSFLNDYFDANPELAKEK